MVADLGYQLADSGKNTDAGTILIMIGLGTVVGLAVAWSRLRAVPDGTFKRATRRYVPLVIPIAVIVAVVGFAIHHY